jgi:hypothetical protein
VRTSLLNWKKVLDIDMHVYNESMFPCVELCESVVVKIFMPMWMSHNFSKMEVYISFFYAEASQPV